MRIGRAFKSLVTNRFVDDISENDAQALSIFNELKELAEKRPYSKFPHEERMAKLSEMDVKGLESRMRGLSSSVYKEYSKWLKAHYIKEVLPDRYDELSGAPIQNKVVFMEKSGPNSPTNNYIAKVIKGQGVYEVVKIGLHQNNASSFEMYENAVHLIEEMCDAKALFISSENPMLSHFDVRTETKVIQLWHGCGVFKKIGYSTLGSGKFGMSAKAREEYDGYRNYSYVCIPSEEQAWIFEDAMHIPANSGKLVPVGVSRTDRFYNLKFAKNARKKLEERLPQIAGKKIILYAPTYRGRISEAYAPDALDVSEMAAALSDDYVLLLKYHSFGVNTRPPLPEEWKDKFAFDMKELSLLSIEQLLAIADICITDYSSIGFEYAILERPIIFFAYDIDQYLDERGMYYNYDEITPGPVCKTTQEMVEYIEGLKDGFDSTEIHAFKEKYVGMCDGHATERTIALIES
jgi:CDP-ribitol ribitolphosphotransferase / teichoic acid ribitol-phosphate polymerase